MTLLSLRAKLLGGLSLALILGFVAYCHHRDTGLVRQGVNQERTRQADSVITVTDTLTVTQTKWLAKALSRRDSQLIATRFEFANALNGKSEANPNQTVGNLRGGRDSTDKIRADNEKPVDTLSASTGAALSGAAFGYWEDTTVQHLVRVCNTQIASDSTALAAALSALHTCEQNGAAWKAKALIVQPQPSRVKPFVAGVVTALGAIGVGAIIVHHRK